MSEESGHQGTNGYTSLEEIEQAYSGVRYKDVLVDGKKFQLRSITTEAMVRLIGAIQKHPRSQNQRVIIEIVSQPKFSQEQIARLAKLDAAFIAQLSKECMAHAGLDAIDAVESEEKN